MWPIWAGKFWWMKRTCIFCQVSVVRRQWSEVLNSDVSGHSKPASVGEMKTGHFEAKGIRRSPSAVVPPLSEAEHGESARNGDCSIDSTPLFITMVTAA